VGLLTIDAHFDLRDTSNGLHNGNPLRALLDDGMPGANIVQIGIAPFANSGEYMRVANEAGIKVVPVTTTRHMDLQVLVHEYLAFLADRVDAIYVDLDVDVLDRAFAPACPGARPGGLSPGSVIEACYEIGANPKVKAMDIVEIDPEKDINDCTCLAAGMFLLSFACGVVARLEAMR
jgi:formiminoglutamase